MRLLVTGAGGSAATNFIDAVRLDAADHHIVGTDTRPFHLELAQVEARYLVPPVTDVDYISSLNRVIQAHNIEFVHPQPDVEVAFLAAHRHELDAPLFLPESSVVELCQDKMRFNSKMREASVPVPEAHPVLSREHLADALNGLLAEHPRVWLRAARGAGSRGSLPVSNVLQAEGWIDYWADYRDLHYSDFMISEMLPGREFAWQSLWWNGELVTSMARERVEYIFGNLTPSGQTSSPSVARTVTRADVNRIGAASVRAADPLPNGVYCVDMKEGVDGRPRVTEINAGRFFTTSNFFAHAGLNMPSMYLTLGTGGKLDEQPRQYDPLAPDLYWVRMTDMGYRLVRDAAWSSSRA